MNNTILAFSLALLFAGCANAPAPRTTLKVPEVLTPGANESLAFILPARGEQIYECREKKDQPGAYDWAFVAPDAELFDGNGKRIGRHYAGPQWEAADGSKVIGAVKQRANAPSPEDIPWLLLETTSVGKDGVFSKVTSIQRVATSGGVAPAGGCPLAGYRIRMPYTADYYLFSAK